MKSSELQDLARKRNWALWQLKGMQGNLNAVAQAGVSIEVLRDMLQRYEELVKKRFSRERTRILQEKIQKTLLKSKKD